MKQLTDIAEDVEAQILPRRVCAVASEREVSLDGFEGSIGRSVEDECAPWRMVAEDLEDF